MTRRHHDKNKHPRQEAAAPEPAPRHVETKVKRHSHGSDDFATPAASAPVASASPASQAVAIPETHTVTKAGPEVSNPAKGRPILRLVQKGLAGYLDETVQKIATNLVTIGFKAGADFLVHALTNSPRGSVILASEATKSFTDPLIDRGMKAVANGARKLHSHIDAKLNDVSYADPKGEAAVAQATAAKVVEAPLKQIEAQPAVPAATPAPAAKAADPVPAAIIVKSQQHTHRNVRRPGR